MEDVKDTTQVTEPVDDKSAQQVTDPVKDEPTEKMFTQAELDAIIEKRLSKERKKMEQKIKEEADQAAKMAQMSEAERQQALFDKKVKEFEQKEQEFNEAQAALNKEKMLNETSKQLAAKNLPIEFAEQLMAETAEDTLKNIDNFEAKWQEAINKAMESKLKGATPTSPRHKEPTKDLKTMSFSEFAEYKRNKDQ